jgi:hypothetical protein
MWQAGRMILRADKLATSRSSLGILDGVCLAGTAVASVVFAAEVPPWLPTVRQGACPVRISMKGRR